MDGLDPFATGEDGLSQQPSIDAFGGDGGSGIDGGLSNSPGPTDASALPDNSFWSPPPGSGMSGFGPSPPNGLSGTTSPFSAGGILSTIGAALGLSQQAQAFQNQQQIASQPLLARLGLSNPSTGQITTTGMLIIAGGAALLFFVLRR